MQEEELEVTREWVEKFVIGLNLCPIASTPAKENRIQYFHSGAKDIDVLYQDLMAALLRVVEVDPEVIETAIVVHPYVLNDFEAYLDFLELAEEALEKAGLEGILQIASFHPNYQFEGTEGDDLRIYPNRSPYPMLHILREASVSDAVDRYPDIDQVPIRNIELMKSMGLEKLKTLRGF